MAELKRLALRRRFSLAGRLHGLNAVAELKPVDRGGHGLADDRLHGLNAVAELKPSYSLVSVTGSA